MTNPNDPASPTYKPAYGDKGQVIAWVPIGGLTKREAFAKAAMAGLCASQSRSFEDHVFDAVKLADLQLAELAKGET